MCMAHGLWYSGGMPVMIPQLTPRTDGYEMYTPEGDIAISRAIGQVNHLLADGRAPLTGPEIVAELRAALERTCGEDHAEWRDTEPRTTLEHIVVAAAREAGIAVNRDEVYL